MSGEYKVGALSALISGGGDNANAAADKKSLDGLFTTDKKQKSYVPKTSSKSEQLLPTEVLKTRKRKNVLNQEKVDKKAKLLDKLDKEDDLPEYTKPSLGSLVKMEDAKERIVDAEKEKRTVFVGNLPMAIKERKLRKIFAEFGTVETVRKN